MLVLSRSEVGNMVKLSISIDDDTREDLRELAAHKNTTMAALVRYALDKTFEEQLDIMAAKRALEEAARDPSSTTSLEDYIASRKEQGGGGR